MTNIEQAKQNYETARSAIAQAYNALGQIIHADCMRALTLLKTTIDQASES